MTIKVTFHYNMEYYLKTWSEISLLGTGLWTVNAEELSEEWVKYLEEGGTENPTFKDFLEDYFHSFSGLDFDDSMQFSIDEEDLKHLETYCKRYAN